MGQGITGGHRGQFPSVLQRSASLRSRHKSQTCRLIRLCSFTTHQFRCAPRRDTPSLDSNPAYESTEFRRGYILYMYSKIPRPLHTKSSSAIIEAKSEIIDQKRMLNALAKLNSVCGERVAPKLNCLFVIAQAENFPSSPKVIDNLYRGLSSKAHLAIGAYDEKISNSIIKI